MADFLMKKASHPGRFSYLCGVKAAASTYTRAAPMSRSSLTAADAVAPVVIISSISTTDLFCISVFASGSSARAAFCYRAAASFRVDCLGVNARLRSVARQGRPKAAAIGLASSSA